MKRFSALLILGFCCVLLMQCGQRLTEEQMFSEALNYKEQAMALETEGLTDEANELYLKAIKSYEKFVKEFPQSDRCTDVLYELGTLYLNNLQDPEKSIAVYQRIIDEYPDGKWVVQAQFMIGYRYANDVKNFEKARESYTLFLQKYPDHELAMSAKWELENLGKDITDIEFLEGEAAGTNVNKN